MKKLRYFKFNLPKAIFNSAKILFLIAILLAISAVSIETSDKNPDWSAYEYAYYNSTTGFEPLYQIFSGFFLHALKLDFSKFYFILVLIHLALIAYLIRNPIAALIGCVSLFYYIETNVGTQIRWGLAATISMVALQQNSRLRMGFLAISSIFFQFFAIVPVSIIFFTRYCQEKLAKNYSIILSFLASIIMISYFSSIIDLIIPIDFKYYEYLNSAFSNYKSLSSITYLFIMFLIEIMLLKLSNVAKVDKLNILMLIYLRIFQIASLSFSVISGRLLIYSMLMEVLVMRDYLKYNNFGLIFVYAFLSSLKILQVEF